MRSERIVKRQAQRKQLDNYKRMFREATPLINAVNQLNQAFLDGVNAERARILSATKDLTYEG